MFVNMDIHWVGPSTIVTNQPFVPTYIYSLFGYFACFFKRMHRYLHVGLYGDVSVDVCALKKTKKQTGACTEN